MFDWIRTRQRAYACMHYTLTHKYTNTTGVNVIEKTYSRSAQHNIWHSLCRVLKFNKFLMESPHLFHSLSSIWLGIVLCFARITDGWCATNGAKASGWFTAMFNTYVCMRVFFCCLCHVSSVISLCTDCIITRNHLGIKSPYVCVTVGEWMCAKNMNFCEFFRRNRKKYYRRMSTETGCMFQQQRQIFFLFLFAVSFAIDKHNNTRWNNYRRHRHLQNGTSYDYYILWTCKWLFYIQSEYWCNDFYSLSFMHCTYRWFNLPTDEKSAAKNAMAFSSLYYFVSA